MICRECDRFCRFPNNPKNGICAEIVQEIISENTNCKAVYVSEESKCYQPWYYPQKAEPIVAEEKQTNTAEWKDDNGITYCSNCKYEVWGSGLSVLPEWKHCPCCGRKIAE